MIRKILINLLLIAATSATSALAQNTPTENSEGQQKTDSEEATQTLTPPKRIPGDAPRPLKPGDEFDAMQVLESNVDKDAILWLEANGEPFLAIWHKDRSGTPKGAVLILHAQGEHPFWPVTMKPLHDTLPDNGWATLAVSLPNPDQPQIPKRTFAVRTAIPATTAEEEANTEEDAAQAEPTETAESTPPIETPESLELTQPSGMAEAITQSRLEAAVKFLHDRGQFNIILLGGGEGAIRAENFLIDMTPKITNPRLRANLEKPIRAMVYMNGRNSLPTEENYNEWFKDPEIPILDIYFDTDPRNRDAARERQIFARQKKVKVYKQVRINELSNEGSWGENRLSRRVRSFLDNHAVGIEVRNARVNR